MSWLAVVGWSALVLLAGFVAFPRRFFVEKSRREFTRRTGAYVDPSFEASFDRETRKMARLLGALILATGVVAVALPPSDPGAVIGQLAIVPLIAAGVAVYATVRLRSTDRLFRISGGRTSVARPVRVELSDYVGGWTRAATAASVALALAFALLLVVLWHRGDASPALAAVGALDAAIALGLFAGTYWLGRVLCERPTPAVDASHLYLQDAWRATTLSRAHAHVGYICHLLVYGTLLSGSLPRGLMDSAFVPLVIAVSCGWPVIVLIQPRQFRRRLWRGLPSGQTLFPGQQLPHAGSGA